MATFWATNFGAITGALGGFELATTGGFGTIAIMKALGLASLATGPVGPIVLGGAAVGAGVGYVGYKAGTALCRMIYAIAESIADSIASNTSSANRGGYQPRRSEGQSQDRSQGSARKQSSSPASRSIQDNGDDPGRRWNRVPSEHEVNMGPYDATAKTIQEANQNIINRIIDYLSQVPHRLIPTAARKFIISRLRQSTPFVQFYSISTVRERVVEVVEIYQGSDWKLLLRIDIDNPPGGWPHVGYEIHLNGKKVVVGHVYIPSSQVQVARLGLNNSLSQEIAQNGIEKTHNENVEWKCTVKRLKE